MIRVRYLICLAGLFVAVSLYGGESSKGTTASTVYVSRILDGLVVAIDTNSSSIEAFVRTGTNPAEVAVVDAVDRAYVADLTDGTIAVIDPTNHSVEKTIDVGHPVASIDADQSTRTIYALDFSNGTPGTDIHEIDADTSAETAVVAVGSRLQNIAVDQGSGRAYASDFVDGVHVIDTSTLTVATTLSISGLPHGLAVHPNLQRLYVTQLEADAVIVISTVDHSLIGTLAVGENPQWIGLDLVRNKGFVSNEGDDTVSVLDLATDTVGLTPIPVGAEPLTVTVHEVSARAYVYNAGDRTISVIDTIAETVVATLDMMFGDGFEGGDASVWSSIAS